MTTTERAELIALLVLRTGFRETAFDRLTDAELQREYERRMEMVM